MVNKFVMKPHTKAKHDILERYLERWFPILSSWQRGVAYIDGFAGPGVYSKDERGSPIIALNTANDYAGKRGFRARLWFIEPSAPRHMSLIEQVGKVPLKEGIRLGGVLRATFEKGFPGIVEELKADGMPPTFVFVDPSGHSGVKMDTLARFLENPRCEFMFTLMESSLKRFVALPENERRRKLTELFGTDSWSEALGMKGYEQIKFFRDLYTKQLKIRGITHTLTFEMRYKSKKTIYHLIFATNSKRGLEVMKESMVKVDPKFTFSVSDVMVPGQTHVINYENSKAWYKHASDLIFRRYVGKADVPLSEIQCFVITDTPYLYKAGIISYMKDSGLVVSKVPYDPAEKMKKDFKYLITFSKSRPAQKRAAQTRLDQGGWNDAPT